MPDKYHSIIELEGDTVRGKDYDVAVIRRPQSPILVVAPHGGRIEAGTSELAELIAADEHNLFAFAGLRPHGNRDLHITSSRFDHPDCRALLSHCSWAIGIHGCRGNDQIYVGGLEATLVRLVACRLSQVGLAATVDVPPQFAGRDRMNVCNRGTLGAGAQLEITMDLRSPAGCARIAPAVRQAISDFLKSAPASTANA